MTTPLYPTIQKRINDAFDDLITKQVIPCMFFNSGMPMRIKKHDGKQIHYEGVGFEGSPEQVFWSRYIEPFMEEICVNEIELAVKKASEKGVDAKLLLPEVEQLLLSGIRKTYKEMAITDQRIKGKGFPDKIPLKPIDNKCSSMKDFIHTRIKSELEMWKPSSKLKLLYKEYEHIVWIIGAILAIGGIIASIV